MRKAREGADLQPSLFDEQPVLDSPDQVGYRVPTACAAADITYRQLDYWARTGLVEPSVRGAQGSGSQRLYSFRDILVLKVVKRLLETGVSLPNIRVAVDTLRAAGTTDVAEVTLIGDGSSVYEATSAEEVFDLLRGGQGVFAIAIGPVADELKGELAKLPGETGDGTLIGDSDDELASRRRRRTSA